MIRSANPDMFIIERDLDHPLSLVWWAFADLDARKSWYGGEGNWEVSDHTLDFRTGGREHWRGRPTAEAPWMTNDALYLDIVPNERIIHVFYMTMDEKLFTTSQQVLEFSGDETRSHVKLTEQIIYVDGIDHPEDRRRGTEDMFTKLDDYLQKRGA